MDKKLNIGWFSFTCCEDSTIIFTELLNTNYKKWSKIFNFKHARVLQKENEMGPFDVSFVEGAVSSDEQKEKAKQIRNLSKKIVAVGACACVGMPSSQRNKFTKEQTREIQFLLDRFNYSDQVYKLEDVIKVDYKIPGCPMNEEIFLETIEELRKKFKIRS